MNNKILLSCAVTICLWACFLGYLTARQHRQLVWPTDAATVLDDATPSAVINPTNTDQRDSLGIVYGFLPYWQTVDYTLPDVLTHIAYFRLAMDARGRISDDVGLSRLATNWENGPLAAARRTNRALDLTIFSTNSDDLYYFATHESAQNTLTKNLLALLNQYNFDGINLDFEYLGTLTDQERANFTSYLYHLKQELNRTHPRVKLSIDVYGSAAAMSQNLWDFSRLDEIVDRIVVMGYDYTTTKANTPNSTAPILGKSIWQANLWDDLANLLTFVPAQKVILAIPFYGYDWETTTCDLDTAKTYPDTGKTLTYAAAQKILNNRQYAAREYWDNVSLSPYLVYHADNDDGENRCHIGFFENERSVAYKMDVVAKLHLGGIAIWSLGYEGDSDNLWTTIQSRF